MADADMENSETMAWIDFAFACGYIGKPTQEKLTADTEEVGKILFYMAAHPEKFR
jgi:hypothetical protein